MFLCTFAAIMRTEQLKVLFWLVKTFMKKDLTLNELNHIWLKCEISGGVELSYQNLRRWRQQVDKLWGIIIEYDHSSRRYHLVNMSPIKYREYKECYKIVALGDVKPETVEIEVYGSYVDCFRALPHHESQREIQTGENSSIFRLRVRPTNYFCGELLMAGDNIKVLKPKWMADLFLHIHEHSACLYKKC